MSVELGVQVRLEDAARAPSPPDAFALDWATVRVLWARDVVRFFRQPSRVIGALAQPVLFWFVIGSGFAGTFRLPGAEHIDYLRFFYPGVVAMVLLFSAIFATITVVEDRKEGFLQAVLAGPGSRAAIVAGKSLGSTTIALLQAVLFLLLAPAAGVSLAQVDYPLLTLAMVLTALALTAVGVSLAWWVSAPAGYHAVMSIVLIPMWVLSGAMFPIRGAGPVLGWIMRLNPMRFAVEAIRRALYGPGAAAAVGAPVSSGWGDVLALAGFAAVFLALASASISRRE